MSTVPRTPGPLDPAGFLGPRGRIFIDTNVFLETDPRRRDALKSFFKRVTPVIEKGGSALVVPTKVIRELEKQSRARSDALTADRVTTVERAKSMLTFLDSAAKAGLVRDGLGEQSNPYADDLFVQLFARFANTYDMCLLTNDITLRVRIRLLRPSAGTAQVAGVLTADGAVGVDNDQELLDKAIRKLQRKRTDGDRRAVAELEPLVEALKRVPGVVPAPLRAQPFTRSATLKPSDRALSPAVLPRTGDLIVVTSAGGSRRVALGEKVGQGGEGAVFDIGGGEVVKIFDAEHRTEHRKRKVELLVNRGLDHRGICFPRASVTTPMGDFVGYAMSRATGRELQRTVFTPRRFKAAYPGWKKRDLVDVCISFLEGVVYLHSMNIIAGDINPKNLMVDDTKRVWIIDADSWQLEGYPCPVGTPMFTSPRLQGQSYAGVLRTMEDELYAVATTLFMILITGQFPYARTGSDGDIPQLIRAGVFTFQFRGRSDQNQPEGNWKYMWSHLPVNVKSLFWHTFHRDGERYARRPSAAQWLDAFRDYGRYLESDRNFDPMSNDVYPTRFKAMTPETPIYECAKCRTSMAGIWREETSTYDVPKLCRRCRQGPVLACVNCARDTPERRLIQGLCPDCVARNTQAQAAPTTQTTPTRTQKARPPHPPRRPQTTQRSTARQPPRRPVPTSRPGSSTTGTSKKSIWDRITDWLSN